MIGVRAFIKLVPKLLALLAVGLCCLFSKQQQRRHFARANTQIYEPKSVLLGHNDTSSGEDEIASLKTTETAASTNLAGNLVRRSHNAPVVHAIGEISKYLSQASFDSAVNSLHAAYSHPASNKRPGSGHQSALASLFNLHYAAANYNNNKPASANHYAPQATQFDVSSSQSSAANQVDDPSDNNDDDENSANEVANAADEPATNAPALGYHTFKRPTLNDSWHAAGGRNCGRQQAREPKIVGGKPSGDGEFPWAISIQRHGNHHCGGVIVGKRWILTAAHCVRNQLVTSLVVRVGGQALSARAAPNGRDYLVEKIIIHDDFHKHANASQSNEPGGSATSAAASGYQQPQSKVPIAAANNADIALIKLRRDVQYGDAAWPVCFPAHDSGSFSGADTIAIGWGKLSEKSDDFSAELQKVHLVIVDNKICQGWFRQAGRDMHIDERIICAGYRNGGKDACHGDSGGPLLARAPLTGQYAVVGVVSTGVGCARPLLPGLYSRVSSYLPWIERYVGL